MDQKQPVPVAHSASTLKTEPPAAKNVQAVKPEPIKVLLTWKSPERVFKKRNREYFATIGAIVFLLVVILLFIKEWLLITVIIALSFFAYVLATIEPEEVEHQITNRGVVTGGHQYLWPELGRFWFSKRWGQPVLQVECLAGIHRHLFILLGEIKEEAVKKILAEYLLLQEPEKTWVDNASTWLSNRVPLETS